MGVSNDCSTARIHYGVKLGTHAAQECVSYCTGNQSILIKRKRKMRSQGDDVKKYYAEKHARLQNSTFPNVTFCPNIYYPMLLSLTKRFEKISPPTTVWMLLMERLTYRLYDFKRFSVQLTTSRIGNLTRLIHTLLYVMTMHTHINTACCSNIIF